MTNKITIMALLLIALGTPSIVFSQSTTSPAYTISCISKGHFVIGSRVGFSTNRSKVEVEGNKTGTISNGTQTSQQYNITPSIAYFFTDRFLIGVGMDYLKTASSNNTNTTTATGETSDSRVLFGPQIRYYFPLSNDQAFYLGLISGFGTSNTQVVVAGKVQKINTNINSFGFGPGYTIFADNCWAMEAQMKYNFGRTKSTIDISGVQQTTNARTNAFDFVIGISYYFGK